MSSKAKIIIAISAGVAIILMVVSVVAINRGSDNRNLYPAKDSNESNQDEAQNTQEPPITKNPELEELNSPGESEFIPIISRISQDVNMVFIKAFISTLENGKCVLEMNQGDSVVTKEVGVIPQPAYLQCDGFEVKKSELGKPGDWIVKVIYNVNGKNYESKQQIITIN